jgi:3-hydroxyisobutyrate dehydrogenase-like beta-hydroxyacid dehydrogenase
MTFFFFNLRGGKFLEAPVSGSKVPADMAQLIFLCAGDEEVGIMCNKFIEIGHL